MKLITKEIERLCKSNLKKPENERMPYLKLFNAYGHGVWLISEIEDDGKLFGLCDLGFGTPELGYVHIDEIKEQKWGSLPMIERDAWFKPEKTLMQYYDSARSHGEIRT